VGPLLGQFEQAGDNHFRIEATDHGFALIGAQDFSTIAVGTPAAD
jgi:hypothetical protein